VVEGFYRSFTPPNCSGRMCGMGTRQQDDVEGFEPPLDDCDLLSHTLVDPQPPGRGGDHGALPPMQVRGAFQVRCLGMQVHRPVGITDAEQGDLRSDGRCPIGDLDHLRTGLGCNSDGQGRASVELFGEVDDQPGLAGTWR
jgi:hypothetical protein